MAWHRTDKWLPKCHILTMSQKEKKQVCGCPAQTKKYVFTGAHVIVVNSLAPGKCSNHFKNVSFKFMIQNEFLSSCKTAFRCMQSEIVDPVWSIISDTTELHWSWQVNTGSGNGLVLSGKRSLPKPMLCQIYVAISKSQWVKMKNSYNTRAPVYLIWDWGVNKQFHT